MVDIKENYIVPRFQERRSNICRGGGGPTFSRAGSNCLFPKYICITCDLPGGPRPAYPPPLGLYMYAGEKKRITNK